jgi:hypothetical protein
LKLILANTVTPERGIAVGRNFLKKKSKRKPSPDLSDEGFVCNLAAISYSIQCHSTFCLCSSRHLRAALPSLCRGLLSTQQSREDIS